MRAEKVQKRSEVIVECEMFDAVSLSKDIPWMITEMDSEEKSNNVK